MFEELLFTRIMELEQSTKEKPLSSKVLENCSKYNCYTIVLIDLGLEKEFSEYKRRKKCQEES